MSEPGTDATTHPAGEDLSDDEMAEQVESQTSSLREADLGENEDSSD
jgi:hypothetical protein